MTKSTPSPTPSPQGGGEAHVLTTCPYCGVGCGVRATAGQGGVAIVGDERHPANRGKLCVKGAALGETLGMANRLLAPHISGLPSTWDTALDLIARRFKDTIATHGPDSVAFYVSGQLLTEDYYVANKLMKGFIGSGNIDTNSRLCMASSVAAHRRAFGTDTVPGQYADLELADLVVLTGSNLAWCHPVLYQRLAAAKAARPTMQVVVIDPRRTATCDIADLHLAIAPGADAHLFNLLLAYLADTGQTNGMFLQNVTGYAEAVATARLSDTPDTGLSPADLERFLSLWAKCEHVVTLYSQGVNQSDSGTDKVNAIINCHLATGRIGRPGMGPFSITGQPNAMGGREVGGMANTLACHLEIENPRQRAAVQGFWAAPTMAAKPGLKAVDMFHAVESGQIKALWIIHTNPAVTMPEAARVARAIAACAFTVVSDINAETDTARLAQVLLPAAAWGEKDGTVTNSERMISRQRAFLTPPGQARPDWWALAQVAQRMGFAGFDWAGCAEIFREHAALSGVAGALGSDFDISDKATVTEAEYARMEPFVWPATASRQGGRFFGDGCFHTPDGRGRMLAITPAPKNAQPFILNTGRIRDQWHTMTRTGMSARLSAHLAEPFLEIHPADAARLGLASATLARVQNEYGSAILRVLITDRVQPGHPFAPIHWTGETAPSGRIAVLVPAVTDPISGQPASKSAAVTIAPFAARWYGFALSAQPFRPNTPYWARSMLALGMQAELAGDTLPDDWASTAATMFNLPAPQISLSDPARGLYRCAFLQEGRLQAALFIAPTPVALSRSHMASLLQHPAGPSVLAGLPGKDQPDPGPTICACFTVGAHTIARAIADQGLVTVSAIGAALQAGTNCGSCQPDIAGLIARYMPMKEAAE